MTTDQQIDSPEATSDKEPLPTESADSKDHQQETDKEKDAAAETDEQKAERLRNEAKMWEGRANKAKEKLKDKAAPVSEEDLDWKIANSARVALVKEAYDKEISDLQESGAKITPALRTKALEYAESKIIVQPTGSPDNSLPAPGVDRTVGKTPKLTEHDQAFGIKPETKKEFADYVEGR